MAWVLFESALLLATLSNPESPAPREVEGEPARAEVSRAEPARDEVARGEPARDEPSPAPPPFVLGAYAEAFYQWNFNGPSNGITNVRGFDNRHDTFTLANVAFDARWDSERLLGRMTLQFGHTPSTYYSSEPALAGSSGANATSAELWKYLQQAYVGYRFDVGRGLEVTAGLFLSPIGPEGMAVRDNWSWSRSNLFFGLPFYHTGVRAKLELSDRWSITAGGYNGWNSVVDGNDEKSVSGQLEYRRDETIHASFLYFGGVERPREAVEGRAFRHLFDAHVTWNVTASLSLIAHANGGFEPNAFGTSGWGAGALHARHRLVENVFVAARGDVFVEEVAASGEGRATPIFWAVPWVSSGTLTIDYRPHPRVSFRGELRHDHAGGPLYFGGAVEGDGVASPFVPNRPSQDTLTCGVTTWF